MAESVTGTAALERRLHAVGGMHQTKLLQRLGLSVVREAKLLVPRKTGNLGRSIHIVSSSPTEVVIAAGAHYAAYVEYGTRSHEITPKAKKALRFAASAAGRRLSGSPGPTPAITPYCAGRSSSSPNSTGWL